MIERVLKTISRYNMLAPVSPGGESPRVCAAVSGGADSVCLLYVLREIAPRANFKLTGVAHFNHKLRAEASDEDEQFVANLAAQLELPFFHAESQVADDPDNLEQAARRARKSFFAELRAKGVADVIALGHTRDDQAETVLFRLLRGSGLAGLAAISPVTADGLIRPLLNVTRAEIEEFLRSRSISWREDATNCDPKFARNRIRRDLLPQLTREWNPRIAESLAHLADLAYEEESWWNEEISRLALGILISRQDGIEMRADVLASLPRAVARRLVRRAISLVKGDLRRIEYDHIEQIIGLEGRVRLPGLIATRSFDWIRIARPETRVPVEPVEASIPGIYPSPDATTRICLDLSAGLDLSTGDLPGSQPFLGACATLRVEACCRNGPPLVLRGWMPGDHYCPLGQSRDQKIKEMFQTARIPSWRRALWPILANGDKILWARQFGPADEFAAKDPAASEGPFLRVREVQAGIGITV